MLRDIADSIVAHCVMATLYVVVSSAIAVLDLKKALCK
jgi:hypothetical protein